MTIRCSPLPQTVMTTFPRAWPAVEHLRQAAAHPKDNPDGYLSELSDCLAIRLQNWAKDATGIPSNTGCLATASSGDGVAVQPHIANAGSPQRCGNN